MAKRFEDTQLIHAQPMRYGFSDKRIRFWLAMAASQAAILAVIVVSLDETLPGAGTAKAGGARRRLGPLAVARILRDNGPLQHLVQTARLLAGDPVLLAAMGRMVIQTPLSIFCMDNR